MYLTGNPERHRIIRLTAPDGLGLPLRHWRNPGAGTMVLYLHGMGDHTGTFTGVGDRLASAGLEVLALDGRGFGLSEHQPRGDIPSFSIYVNDAAWILEEWRRRGYGGRIIVCGLSMGGGLALRLTAERPDLVDGVIALSPGLGLRRTPVGLVIRILAASWLSPGRQFPSPFPLESTTRSQEALAQIKADSRWIRVFTARFFMVSLRHLWRLKSLGPRIRSPVLFLIPEHDRVISPTATRRFFDTLGSERKQLEIVKGAEHNLMVDPLRDRVGEVMVNWAREQGF